MKKVLALFLVSTCVMLLSSSCAVKVNDDGAGQGQSSTETESITVYIASWSATISDLEETFNAASKVFTEKYGTKVERYPMPSESHFGPEESILFREKLYTEIMAGNGPDVLIFSFDTGFPDIYKKMESGVFYDFNEFIDNDDEFDIGEYEQEIMDAGIYKDSRYLMPLNYNVRTLVTSKEKLENTGYSSDDFSTYEQFLITWEEIQQDDNVRLMNNNGSWETFVGSMGWLDECIDFEAGTTNFDLPSFRRVTDIFKTEYRIENSSIETFEEGKFYDARLFYLNMYVVGYIIYEENSGIIPEDMILIPVPNYFGSSIATIHDYCTISSTTKKAEAAWNFVKVMLSDEVQENVLNSQSVTVNSKYIDAAIEAKLNSTYDDAFIEQVKSIHHGYESAVLPYSVVEYQGRIAQYVMREDQDFEHFKEEMENYFKIYMSE